jgi:hypothetical protein
MRIVRTTFAVMLAVALSLAPAANGMAAPAPQAPPHSHHHAQSAAHDHGAASPHQHGSPAGYRPAAIDCCADGNGAVPKAPLPDCGGMPGCALCYLIVLPQFGSEIHHPLERSAALGWQVSQAPWPVAAGGPFRPPRS